MNRREVLQALGAAASAAWVEEGYDPSDLQSWRDEGGPYSTTQEVTPTSIMPFAEGRFASFSTPRGAFEERSVEVFYDSEDIVLAGQANSDDLKVDMSIGFSPEAAREVAVALYQAAEEFEAREETSNG